MNRLVLIGNGFDLAHGLKTSYKDFIDWYWRKCGERLLHEYYDVVSDELCSFKLKTDIVSSWYLVWTGHYYKRKDPTIPWDVNDVVNLAKENRELCDFSYNSVFFSNIQHNIETKGWVDIENEYYQLLKKCTENADCGYSVKELNEQLAFLQAKLIEYLSTIEKNQYKKDLHDAMIGFFDPADFSLEGEEMALKNLGLKKVDLDKVHNNLELQKKLLPDRIMVLSFNYTATAKMYGNFNLDFNYIHGELEHPENIIFGYGDELDKGYQDILDRNDNELLKNVKSVKYLETRHYHDLLAFLKFAPFQVLIMGHSCGNSDRTLLNTVFEHENCVSIKPFYHEWDDGSDNYLELVQNISRNFTNPKLFRDRVVNKEQCSTI